MFPGGELLPAAPLQPCAGAPSGRGHLFSGWVNLAPCNFFQQQCPPCSTGMGHPLGMAPCAEAPHPVGGLYPSLASIFPAHYCPLYHLVSFLRAITLTLERTGKTINTHSVFELRYILRNILPNLSKNG